MTAPLRFALVGVGANIAPTHLSAIEATADAELVAACDLHEGAEAALDGSPSASFYTDHRRMLWDAAPDVVVIATPHPTHGPLVADCFEAGCHVLVEKPIAPDVAEADRMIAAARRTGRLLAVNFQHRFAPLAVRARQLLDEGAVGPLVRVLCTEPWLRTAAYFRAARWRATWRGEGGGVLLNQAPHTLDLLCHLVGMPNRVLGVARTLRHDTECEDSAHALLEFDAGALGYVSVSTVEAGARRRLEVVGERGRLDIDGDRLVLTRFEPSLDRHIAECRGPFDLPAARQEPPEALAGGRHVDVYRDLVRAVREGRPPRSDGESARMSLELANAITLSSHRERPVDLPLDRAAYSDLLSGLREREW